MNSQSDYQHFAEFRYQIRKFLQFRATAARNAGVEPQQHQLMLAVKGAPDTIVTTIQYLAHRLCIQHNSAVELVNRSVKKGLVVRRRDDTDLRRVAVRLTPKGEKIVRSLIDDYRAELMQAGTELLKSLRPLLRGSRNNSQASSRRAPRRMARRMIKPGRSRDSAA